MVRTSCIAAALALSLVACADDPVASGGYGGTNKPTSTQVATPSTSVNSPTGESAGQETRCLNCTVLRVQASNGDWITFVDNVTGDELCGMRIDGTGLVSDDTCAEIGILPPMATH